MNNKEAEDAKFELYDWVQCIIGAVIVGILVFMFIARVVNVDGSSMFPTLHNGDKMIVSNLFYEPEQGDIIVFQTDNYGEDSLVKRVIATEGQTVDIDFNAGVVYVDGVAQDEPYTNTSTNVTEDFSGPVTVPEGCIFVMGDNRNASLDSRSSRVGFVDKRCIIGKVYVVAIPGVSVGEKFNAGRIGSVYD